MVLMFGMVPLVGASVLVGIKDLSNDRNMAIASVILIIGVGGLNITFGKNFVLGGIGLAGIVGVLINLILPKNQS